MRAEAVFNLFLQLMFTCMWVKMWCLCRPLFGDDMVTPCIWNPRMNTLIFLDVPSLNTNIIAQLREPTYESCGLKCAENRFCVAVNYKKNCAWNEPNCQLTNSTEGKFDHISSKKEQAWTFIKVNVDRSQVVSKCILYTIFCGLNRSKCLNRSKTFIKYFNFWNFSKILLTEKTYPKIGIKVSEVYRPNYIS
jgi:hypothetical protein